MKKPDTRGFTLLEMIVSVGIFILLISSITGVFLSSFRSKNIIFDQLASQSEGRKASQDFVNEARSATYSSGGAYPISVAAASELTFYANIDQDTLVERIHYYLSGDALKKGIVEPSGGSLSYVTSTEQVVTVADNINNGANPLFYYYDETYTDASSTPLTYPIDLTKIRMIGISLNVDKDPNLSPTDFNIQAKSELRNLE